MKTKNKNTRLEKSYYKKRVLITGGAGFIGEHLQRKLSGFGADTYIVDKKAEYGNVIRCDICNAEALKKTLKEIAPEIVFHLAADTDRTLDFETLKRMISVNIVGTLNLFESLKDFSSCSSIVIAGTSEEYGNNDVPFKEKYREDPVSPYSFSKVCISQLSGILFDIYRLPVIILRATIAYGPGQGETMFIPALIKTLLGNGRFMMTRGEQTRDFIYIDDLVNAYLKAGVSEGYFGQIFNIGSGKPYKIKDIAYRVASILKKEPFLMVGAKDYRKTEIMSYYVDISKAKACLGWIPKVDIDEGLKMTIESYADEKK